MAEISTDIHRAINLLQAGEVVAIPTETVYGLAGNAIDPQVVSKIFEIKERPSFDPLIMHSDRLSKIESYLADIPEPLAHLLSIYSPGPLTVLLKRKSSVPDITCSGLEKVAVRIPSHPVTRALLEAIDFPLAAPSANPFGYISPTTAQHVQDQLGDKIRMILDGEASAIGLESTVIDWRDEMIVILRQGAVTAEDIRSHGYEVQLQASSSNPSSPGMLSSHYAPRTALSLDPLPAVLDHYDTEDIAYLGFRQNVQELPQDQQYLLSPSGNMQEAAQRLFALMRQLDQGPHKIIVCQLLPEEGLGRAINDKLRRAAHGSGI